LRSSGKEHSPIVSAFWNASTDAPATASTSGRRLFIRFPSACQEQKSGRGKEANTLDTAGTALASYRANFGDTDFHVVRLRMNYHF
jgi:hypothetical protein